MRARRSSENFKAALHLGRGFFVTAFVRRQLVWAGWLTGDGGERLQIDAALLRAVVVLPILTRADVQPAV